MRALVLSPLIALALAGFVQAESPSAAIAAARAQHAQLQKSFETFTQRLAILVGRLESSGKPGDLDRAKRIKKALKEASERGTEGTIDFLVRGLGSSKADKDVDLLEKVVKENKKLSADLDMLIRLLTEEEAAALKKRADELRELLEKLKDLRAREARLQAKNDMGKADPKDLAREQDALKKETEKALDGKDAPAKAKDLVGKAAQKEGQAGKLLDGKKPGPASDKMGEALKDLDGAIDSINDELTNVNRTRRGKKLRDLLARVKAMLRMQLAIRDGIDNLYLEIRLTRDEIPTVKHQARANELSREQTVSLREAESALKLLEEDGTGVAFIESMGQIKKDMGSVALRLDVYDVGKLTQKIADDVVESLKDMVQALEKAVDENEKPPMPPPPGPGPRPGPKPPLVNLLQQLKMIAAMQKRVNGRTALYARRFSGEQAPMPEGVKDARERKRLEIVRKEMGELSGRQASIRKVIRGLGLQKID